MYSKKIQYFFCTILILIILTLPLTAVDKDEFKDCASCRENIETLYEKGEIDVVKWALYNYYLSNNPFDLPEKARCNLHKGYIKSITYLLENKETYLNETVKIKGTFQGWDGKYGPPPVTRSDWIIADSTDGIYVYGPFPAGLHPAEKEDRGKELFITGILKKIKYDEKAMYYLELIRPKLKN